MFKIGVVGVNGRMGRLILREVITNNETVIAGATVKLNNPIVGTDCGTLIGEKPIEMAITNNNEKLFAESDVIIDFTSPQASVSHATLAQKHKTPLVIGTTGLNNAQEEIINQAAKDTSIVYAANTSLGVNLLAALVEQAAQALNAEYDIEICEMHHRNKVDAPSGTALFLAQNAANGRQSDLQKILASGNRSGERKTGNIGFSVLRGGGVIGDHDVVFAAADEMITLSHRALDRSLFAKGAVKAAIWLAKNTTKNGLFTMRDVLGLQQ